MSSHYATAHQLHWTRHRTQLHASARCCQSRSQAPSPQGHKARDRALCACNSQLVSACGAQDGRDHVQCDPVQRKSCPAAGSWPQRASSHHAWPAWPQPVLQGEPSPLGATCEGLSEGGCRLPSELHFARREGLVLHGHRAVAAQHRDAQLLLAVVGFLVPLVHH